MASLPTERALSPKPIRAPRGAALSCKGWAQEASLRLLMNSADPSVAEEAERLIPSGGIGRLARDGQAFQSILEALQKLEGKQTLLIRRGEVAAVLETREEAPRVVVVNAELGDELRRPAASEMALDAQPEAPRYAADWTFTGPASALPEAFRVFRSAARKHFGGSLAGRLVVSAGMGGMGGAQALAVTLNRGAFLGIDASSARIKRREKAGFCEVMVNHLDEALRILKNAVRKREPASVGLVGNAAEVLPELAQRGVLPDLLTDQTPADDLRGYIPPGIALADAAAIQQNDPNAYRERALDSIAAQAGAMLEMKTLGAVVFEFGNGIRARALARGITQAGEIPDFISEYLLADLAEGRALLTVMALSGDLADLAPVDAACLDLFPQSELSDWIAVARKRPTPGLPARSLWMTAAEDAKLGQAINDAVGAGAIKAPVAIIRSTYVAADSRPVTTVPGPPRLNAGGIFEGHAPADSLSLAAILRASSGASWLGVRSASGWGDRHARLQFAAIADGTPDSAARMACAFGNSLSDAVAPFAS